MLFRSGRKYTHDYFDLAINTEKTTEAIALLLKLHQQPMILNHLLKMMYYSHYPCRYYVQLGQN